mgnify:FL=1
MGELKTREEIAPQYKWRLEDLFHSEDAWEQELKRLEKIAPEAARFKGTLNNMESVLEMLRFTDEISLALERLFVYARMSRDTDNACSKYVSWVDRVTSLMVRYDESTSYIRPELNDIDSELLLEWAGDARMKDYDYQLRELVRGKKHVLSDESERILALSGEIGDSYDTIYTMLSDVDLQFAPIKDETGSEQPMSHGRYRLYLESRRRDIRRQAYESMYKAYESQINTVAAIYGSSVKKDVFYTRARNFPSCRERALFGGDIPVSVYDGLLDAVGEKLPVLHDYVALRKRVLGLDDLKMYDMYVPMFEAFEGEYTFEDACSLVLEALAPLGEKYTSVLKKAFSEGWIDVYETKGKSSGAYSWGAYGTHPYMLLNFQGRLDDAFTLAHEAGHSMHSYFSDEAQSYPKAQYLIFVAEVASTVNEVLMLKHLINKTEDEAVKKYLLEFFLEQFRTTVFRQTMFAEFELIAHEHAEKGESLTREWLCETYGGLNKKYYGMSVETDQLISLEWARIPHFYRAFYVYQYATGFCAAVAIASRILKEGQPAVSDYMKFLSSGGSNAPIELLKLAGVDLSDRIVLNSSLEEFSRTLNELKGML